MAKGKRKIVFEYQNLKVNAAELEKNVYQALKLKGVKYSDSIDLYVNLANETIYCVVNNETIAIKISEVYKC